MFQNLKSLQPIVVGGFLHLKLYHFLEFCAKIVESRVLEDLEHGKFHFSGPIPLSWKI